MNAIRSEIGFAVKILFKDSMTKCLSTKERTFMRAKLDAICSETHESEVQLNPHSVDEPETYEAWCERYDKIHTQPIGLTCNGYQ